MKKSYIKNIKQINNIKEYKIGLDINAKKVKIKWIQQNSYGKLKNIIKLGIRLGLLEIEIIYTKI